ncbi:unnamed protein product [Chrysodeixis includens]|uniref:Galactose mutarotase n=1 Tax=Chrysodeixis includens TaxID=689277 RepID=A0A9N8PX50_CHRIL|nr:unnamed protein product [Chrysodeixis includens]
MSVNGAPVPASFARARLGDSKCKFPSRRVWMTSRGVAIIRDHSFHKLRNAKNGINNLYVACSSSVFVAADLKQAVFDGKRAIRGGIPFVFPQFGQWAFGPQHGFARIARWHVEKMPERLPSGDVEAVFSLMDDDFTRSMWHFQFRLTYRLILREKELHFNIGVYNPSKELTFSCQMLLHTYFKVPDVRRCQITGMHGCMFIDKTREGALYQETREVVTINEWTDRIYQNTMQEHIITNVVSGRKMRIQKYNFPDTVIWNPWSEYAKEIPDFGDDEFPNMVCVEAGRVAAPIVLLPGTAFEASQILQVNIA